MTTALNPLDQRIARLPQWAQHYILGLESKLAAAEQQAKPSLGRGDLLLSGERLHIHKLSPDEVDVNYAGIFLTVWPMASNHITLRAGRNHA